MRKAYAFFTVALIAVAGIFGLNHHVYASEASLTLVPATGVYTVGSIFSVAITLNNRGVSVNAAEGELSYNPAEISVMGTSKKESIFNFWTTDPVFSNIDGFIRFAGGTPQSFSGNAGTVITLTLKALKNASSPVRFLSGAILAADGQGTNIISSLGSAAFTFIAKEDVPKAEYVAPRYSPDAPAIVSRTHPDQSVWYAKNMPEFSWMLAGDVNAIRLSINHDELAIPTVVYAPPIRTKKLTDMADGTWDVHLQARNAFGWGTVSTFRFNIDTMKPDRFTVKEIQREDFTDPRVRLFADFSDRMSGIGYYSVRIDTQKEAWWYDNGDHSYVSPPLLAGKHLIVVTAFDKAGNSAVDSLDVLVAPLAAPSLLDSFSSAQQGDPFIVHGTTYPHTQVTVWFQRNNEEPKSETTMSDARGSFAAVLEKKITEGVYAVWAQALDARGATSENSEKVTVLVRAPAFIRIGSAITNILSVIIPLIALIALLVFMTLFIRHRYALFKAKIRKEALEAEETLHTAIITLRNDIAHNLKLLQSAQSARELTEEERGMAHRLKESLDHAERVIRKEIRDIEREADR